MSNESSPAPTTAALIEAARGLHAADAVVVAYINDNQHSWSQSQYERLCDARDEAMLPILAWVEAAARPTSLEQQEND